MSHTSCLPSDRTRPRLPVLLGALLLLATGASCASGDLIPLPEHPRPDFQRQAWTNLNGSWAFRFDRDNRGETERWAEKSADFPLRITVPFPWGSRLSGVSNEADVAWYARSIRIPQAWQHQRVFLVIGACDWLSRAWLGGQWVGEHQGGYTPFALELTPHVRWGEDQSLVLRVDDSPHRFKLEGKQGYGPARGIWQTVHLEARPALALKSIHFLPDIDHARVAVHAELDAPSPAAGELALEFKSAKLEAKHTFEAGTSQLRFEVDIPQPHLWSLEDPFLYELDVVLRCGPGPDRVGTYFGMRNIRVLNLPGTAFPYIALNHRPVYLQMTLDQSYHPDGFYTFPSDAFMRDEILRSRRIGLNANRLHVKIDVPRKLYWADRLGLLLMCDVPNSWGEPDSNMRNETEDALRGMIERDFNHPSIFAWVPFNETWGLFTSKGDRREYLPDTQNWVASVYRLARQLDPTRLVEDNSPCNSDHVETDINSWHAYLPGYAWREHLDQVTRDTYPGSAWNFTGGRKQGNQPLLNSECGNVWGYEGSAGDVDWSWDYHSMMNEFRRHPRICGWLYTEHHDVINEWNGYYRFDRSDKDTGLADLVPGMSLQDLHSPFYLAPESDLCQTVQPNTTLRVPLHASFLTDRIPEPNLVIRSDLTGWDSLGQPRTWDTQRTLIQAKPWMSGPLPDLHIRMPKSSGLAILSFQLETRAGAVLHRNFTTFRIKSKSVPQPERIRTDAGSVCAIRFAPSALDDARWSLKQWQVLGGLKVNGAGHGYFQYRVPWPGSVSPSKVSGGSFLMEASAKQLFGKDRSDSGRQQGDFMRGQGTFDPSLNPNAYPMTDSVRFPSTVRIRINGEVAGICELPDDPADHRGVLSWFAQPHDRHLREAGSYGYLVSVPLPPAALTAAAASGQFVVRLEVDEACPGGLAVFGADFGRYPLDPTFVLHLK